MSVYGSHLPVLKYIFEQYAPKKVLELGVGEESTPFLSSQKCELMSLETDIGWATRQASTREDHKIIVIDPLKWLEDNVEQYDLAFVDHNGDRRKCVELLFSRARLIVAHDTDPGDDWNYHYSEIVLPHGWKRIDYNKLVPWTSVYTADLTVIKELALWVGLSY